MRGHWQYLQLVKAAVKGQTASVTWAFFFKNLTWYFADTKSSSELNGGVMSVTLAACGLMMTGADDCGLLNLVIPYC